MHGLYVMWWVHEKHVPVAMVAAVLAAGDLALTALEFPTGWLADRYGHRVSLIAGSLLQIAGMLYAWLGEGMSGVLASCLLIAVGDAFRSGADQALLYRSCVTIGRESQFQIIEARTRALQQTALVAMVLAGGVIVDRSGFSAGWLVETGFSVAGLAIACAMIEPPARTNEITPDNSSPVGSGVSRIDPLRSTRNSQQNTKSPRGAGLGTLVALVVPAAVLASVASAATFLAQSGDMEPGKMTMIVAGLTLAEAAGSVLGGYVPSSVRCQWILGGLGVAITAVALALPAAFLPAVVALCFMLGLALPLRAAVIQRHTADDVRARAASFASACDKALATIGLIGAGVLPRRVRRRP
jgi:predicted MFS family arabinose efflux permease